ncbi:MAG: MFS transporter [Devosia sp.]
MFSGLWRDREFRRFWSAQTVSEFGDRITELALPLIAVTMLDATAAEVGFLTAAVWLPNLVSLFIGTWVDQQRNKKALMVTADLARTLILLSLPVAYWLGWLSLWHLFAIAILAGTAHVVFNTAYAAYFVRLVPRDSFIEANAKLSGTRSFSFMAGPAVGGLLIQWLAAPMAIGVDALSFVFSAIQISRLKTASAAVEPTEESLLQRARAGMLYLLRHPYMRASLGCATTVNFFTFMGTALLVLFASRNLGLDAGTIGIGFGIGASGGLLGAAIARPLAEWIGAGPLIAISAVVFPLALGIIAFADGPVWMRVAFLVVGEFVSSLSVMTFDIPLVSLQTKVIDDNMRSRVSGAFTTVNFGIRPLGAVVGGLLGSWIGLRETLLIAAVSGALSVLWLVGTPIIKVRSIEGLQPPDLDAPR